METIKLIQKGRWIYVENHTTLIDSILDQFLSYKKNGARFMVNPAWAIVHLYKVKTHRFPIGLLERVKRTLDKRKISYNVDDTNKKISLEIDYGVLRPYQKDALYQILIHKNGIIKIPTGGGKTKVAIQLLKNINLPTLILVPTLDLVSQWSKQIPKNVHVKTYAAIKKKAYVQQFDCVIFDECHHCAAKTLYKIGMNVKQDARLYGLSATPLDREDDNLKVEAVLGTIIYEISTRELIDQGYLCDAKIYYHRVEHMMFGYKKYNEVYDDYIVNNFQRNDIVCSAIENCEKPCLVLINRITHGLMLEQLFKDEDVVFLNGQMKKEERDDTDHDIIIATSIFDEGVDLPDLKTLIIASGGKSSIKATQRIGRLLRPSEDKEYAIVHDFKDDCKYLDKHYKARRAIFDKDFEVFDVDD